MVSVRPSRTSLIALGVLVLAGVATAQPAPDGIPADPNRVSPLAVSGGTVVLNLIVGALLVGLKPDYVRRLQGRIREETLASFLWGLGAYVVLLVAMIVLFVTIVGILVAVPLGILFLVVAVIGNVLALLTVGSLLLDRSGQDGNLWVALVVGVLIAALIGLIPFAGGLINAVIGMIGFGAVISDFWSRR